MPGDLDIDISIPSHERKKVLGLLHEFERIGYFFKERWTYKSVTYIFKLKHKDKENKEHYESLYETKLQEQKENLTEQSSEKQKLWELKEQRYIATVDDLKKKMTQGTTVDQGSSAEMQLGDFLKKIFTFQLQKM